MEIDPEQANPENYFDEGGHFIPPSFAQDKVFFCHDPTLFNIFEARFPRPIHGNIVPDDILLRMYWDLYKDSEPVLKATLKPSRTHLEILTPP